jgi:hypothetical protein
MSHHTQTTLYSSKTINIAAHIQTPSWLNHNCINRSIKLRSMMDSTEKKKLQAQQAQRQKTLPRKK